jgi:membrane protein YqaA with SNARE-associated domain
MSLYLWSFGVSIASALFPLINMEVILGGMAATVGDGHAFTLALVAGAGQTVGKIVWYELTRRSFDTEWVQKRLSGPKVRQSYLRWQARIEGRPWFGGGIMLVSAFAGVPPLLVMAAVAGALKMRMYVFLPTILVGRTLRFWLVLAGVESLLG